MLPCTGYRRFPYIIEKTGGTASSKRDCQAITCYKRDVYTRQPPCPSDLSKYIRFISSVMSSPCAHTYKKYHFLHKSLHSQKALKEIAQMRGISAAAGAHGDRAA